MTDEKDNVVIGPWGETPVENNGEWVKKKLDKALDKNNLKYVSERTYNLFKKTKVYGGEIIMNKIGSAGKYWIMPNLNRPVSLGLNQLMMTFNNLF